MSSGPSSAVAPKERRAAPVAVVAAMRPKQWLKNLLVFAAPLAAGSIFQPDVFWPSVAAFVAFCLMSSATYLLNDVRDVGADRAHPTKRERPVARGDLSVGLALGVAGALAIIAMAIAFAVNLGLAGVLLAYALFTTSYSLFLKHEPVIELALLAMGFLLRAIAGGVASDLPISQWFLIVAGFGSLFMAAGKRFSELDRSLRATDGAGSPSSTDHASARRSLSGYTSAYLRFVWGMSAAVMAVGTITRELLTMAALLSSEPPPWVSMASCSRSFNPRRWSAT